MILNTGNAQLVFLCCFYRYGCKRESCGLFGALQKFCYGFFSLCKTVCWPLSCYCLKFQQIKLWCKIFDKTWKDLDTKFW